MGFLDWLKTSSTTKVPPTAERLAVCIFEAAERAVTTSMLSIATNEKVGRFYRILGKIPDGALMTPVQMLVATALPLAAEARRVYPVQFTGECWGTLLDRLGEFDQRAPQLVLECNQFFDGIDRSSGLSINAVAGIWLIGNLKGSEPTAEEMVEGALVGEALGNVALQWFEMKVQSGA
jgi:hypothetical protein